MDQIDNKIITIAKIEQSAKAFKITDQDGDKYTLWIRKQDGNNTQAFDQYQIMGLMVGKIAYVGFKAEPATFTNDVGKVINYTQRTIISFREATNAPLNNPQPEYQKKQTTQTEPFTETREEYGRRLAIHGMVNGMLASGKNPEEIKVSTLLELEGRINEVLNGKAEENEISESDYPF